MNYKLQKQLKSKYDWLNKNVGDRCPYPMFGIECGDGWYGLLDYMFFSIDRILNGNPQLKEGFYISQIKEKFGETVMKLCE